MRIKWKNWPNVERFVEDNNLLMCSWKKKGTAYANLEETIFELPNGNVLCAVEKVTWNGGMVEYNSYANYHFCADLSSTLYKTHKTFAEALRNAALDSAKYFNKSGTPSREIFFKRKPREANGEIHYLDEKVIAANGLPSWINK